MTLNPYPDLFVGQEFKDLDNDAWYKVTAAIAAKHQSYKVETKNKTVWVVICYGKTEHKCKFKIRVTGSDAGATLKTLLPHTCPASVHANWRVLNSTKWLKHHHHPQIEADRKLKPRTIMNTERLEYANQIPYLQAWRTREKSRQKIEGDIELQAKLLLPCLSAIQHASNGSHIKNSRHLDELIEKGQLAEWDGAIIRHHLAGRDDRETIPDGEEEYTIDAFFVAPHASIQAWEATRPLVCFDGGHMNGNAGGILLTASTLDPDEEILILAFAIVPAESKQWWKYFFKCFFHCFYTEGNLTVISDRAKGLKPALEEETPESASIWHYFCVQHLRDNVVTLHGKEMGNLFFVASEQKTTAGFDDVLNKIEAKNPACAEYIRRIPRDQYAYCAAPLKEYPRFFHTTSNISESSNSTFKPARGMPWVLALDHIWHHLMKQFHERRQRQHHTQRYTRFYDQYYQQELDDSGKYLVFPQSFDSGRALIRRGESSSGGSIVNVNEQTCTCLEWQDRVFPCRHALAAMQHFDRLPDVEYERFEPYPFTVEQYRKTYAGSLHPVILSDLPLDHRNKPHGIVTKKKGRKKEKRLRRETKHSRARKESRKVCDAEKREQAKARQGTTSTTHILEQSKASGSSLSGIQRERLKQRTEHSSIGNNIMFHNSEQG